MGRPLPTWGTFTCDLNNISTPTHEKDHLLKVKSSLKVSLGIGSYGDDTVKLD